MAVRHDYIFVSTSFCTNESLLLLTALYHHIDKQAVRFSIYQQIMNERMNELMEYYLVSLSAGVVMTAITEYKETIIQNDGLIEYIYHPNCPIFDKMNLVASLLSSTVLTLL